MKKKFKNIPLQKQFIMAQFLPGFLNTDVVLVKNKDHSTRGFFADLKKNV